MAVYYSCGLALIVALPIYVFCRKGPTIRKRSKFAQSLENGRKERRAEGGKGSVAGENAA